MLRCGKATAPPAASRVERSFSIDNMVERYTRLYQSLL